MTWLLNNAGTIASLFAIGAYIFGIVKYLRPKMKALAQLPQTSQAQQQEVSVPTKSISLSFNEWLEIIGQGFIDEVDFIINRFHMQDESEDIAGARAAVVMGGGCLVLLGGVFLALVPAIVLAIFGMDFNHAYQVGAQIICILLFLIFSLLYVYVVGERLENRQSTPQQELSNQEKAVQ